MKKNVFSKLYVLFTIVLCVGFTACGGDDGGGDGSGGSAANDETVKKLMAKGWKYSSADYTEYSYGAAVETNKDYLYFLDGQHGVNVWGSKEIDTYFGASNNSGKNFFNYTIQGNRIVINYFNGNTQTLTFDESYLESGGNTYIGFDLTSDLQDAIQTWRFELQEAINETVIEDIINSGVLANIKKTDKFHQQLDITSSLLHYFPSKEIFFIVKTDGVSNKEYYFKDNFGLHLDNILCTDANYSIYLEIYDNLKAKQNSGKTLTSDEREMLNSCTQILNDYVKYGTFEFFVEINGQRFSIPTKYI